MTHGGEKLHNCNQCEYSSRYAGNLETHIAGKHLGQRSHKCDRCSLDFVLKPTLLIHVKRVHEGEKNHKCDKCKYASTADCGFEGPYEDT